ncbi:MAG: hypothetical protein AB7G75_08800 [Candidatus Binatia bacterium]
MNTSLQSFLRVAGTVATAALLYVLRYRPDETQSGTASAPGGINAPSVSASEESQELTPSPARPRRSSAPRRAATEDHLTAKTLLDALALMRPLIQRRPTVPILETVLLEPGQLTMTDLESRLTLHVPALTVSPLCVPAKQLDKALRGITGRITLTADNGWLRIDSDGGQLSLTTFPAAEYPAPLRSPRAEPYGEPFVLPHRFADVLSAVSKDDSRTSLAGVCIDLAHGAVAASNGHVLHLVTGEQLTGEARPLISVSAAKTLAQFAQQSVHGQVFRRTMTNGTDTTTEVTLYFTAPGVELWTRALEAEFPDYQQVIPAPDSLTRTLVADRAALVTAVEQCLPLTTERARGITIKGDTIGLVVSVTNPDIGSVAAPVPMSGADGLTFGVNADYLLAALRTQEATVTIRCSENDPKDGCVMRPLVLNGGPTKAVLMPMRVF